LTVTILDVGSSAETELVVSPSPIPNEVAAALRPKVSWQNWQRGYWRCEPPKSPAFATNLPQTRRRDLGPMSDGGGPVTLTERVSFQPARGTGI
jgi:hypothetical protein